MADNILCLFYSSHFIHHTNIFWQDGAEFLLIFILNIFIWQLDYYITISQWWKNNKVKKCRGGKISRWRSLWEEIVPFSALYYKFHTISILQVRKRVIQVTSDEL